MVPKPSVDLQAHIRAMVDDWPPLTPVQTTRLRSLFAMARTPEIAPSTTATAARRAA